MCLPKLDGAKKRTSAREDRVTTWLEQTSEGAEVKSSRKPSARDSAEEAIRYFQRLFFELTFDQAKETYIRLLVGRGFNQHGVNGKKTTKAASFAPAHDAATHKNKEPHDPRS